MGPIAASILLWVYAQDSQHPTVSEYQKVFLLASIPIVIGLFIIVFFVKEDKKVEDEDKIEVKLSLKEFDGNFKRFLFVIALFTLSNSTDAFLLLRADNAGISPALIPLLWVVLHLSKVVSSLIGGSLSDKFGRKKLIFAGWVLYALVYAGFAFISTAWQAWALFLIYGVYFGLTEGAEKALVADLVPAEKRGTAFGLYNLAFGVTVFPASLILGGIWSYWGAAHAFLLSMTLSFAAALFLLTVKTPETKSAKE